MFGFHIHFDKLKFQIFSKLKFQIFSPDPELLDCRKSLIPPLRMDPNFAKNIGTSALHIAVSCTGKKALTDLALTRWLFLCAYVCVFFAGVVGNLLVVWVVATSKHMQSATNVFIANLAVSDLIVCSTSIWLTPVYSYLGHWVWGGWLCYALPIFQGSSIFISSLTLTAIALDRHWVICVASAQKHSSERQTSKQVCVPVICLIWWLSVLLVLPYAVHMRIAHVQWPCHFSLCTEDWTGKEHIRSVYGVTTMVLQFVLPFAVIGHSYRRIWRFLETRRAILLRPESEAQNQRKHRRLMMLVRMVLVFGICWLPFNLLNLMRDLGADSYLKPYFSFLFLLAHLLSMCAPAANPLLYAWMNSAFRDAFVRVLPSFGRKNALRREISRIGSRRGKREEDEEQQRLTRDHDLARGRSRTLSLSSSLHRAKGRRKVREC